MSVSSSTPSPSPANESSAGPSITDPELLTDPFGGYGKLREQAPIVRGQFMDGTPVWFVTRFDEVREVLRDRRFVNNPTSVPGNDGQDPRTELLSMLGLPVHLHKYLLGNLLNIDSPDHTRLRKLVSRGFTVRRIRALRPRVEEIAAELLAQLPEYADDGVVDLVKHYAYPLPITVICELVGVPETDRLKWQEWGKDLVSVQPERLSRAYPAVIEHIHELIRLRRSALADDLLSDLIRVNDDDGSRVTDAEMVTMVLTLVLAGHSTTAHLIGNGTVDLLLHPDQLQLLRGNPGLLPRAVHELMRRCGPVQLSQLRYATENVEIAGATVHKGEAVQLVFVSANFDPRQYSAPDQLDVTRHPAGQSDNHVGFGYGMHYCLGAALAQQEGEVAFGKLLQWYPNLRLAVESQQLQRIQSPGSWQLAELPLRLS